MSIFSRGGGVSQRCEEGEGGGEGGGVGEDGTGEEGGEEEGGGEGEGGGGLRTRSTRSAFSKMPV
eukprot:CAMPEP_0201522960 /NCGR_PEP_ID=MMETSP0161_2-20130828/18655_1 /ASSEMBLY_ACC=CAM_ASM_000251 /TAXON_ID=180227 /ORGANISM="Neoparamoeba aestuarina, Strain SoJaBio B1-5/56/2" /LENGTH=64 /DNA_ID=CAMNT_0047921943 /DNA_START=164 /DNA_END=358 /DNA_ORIENTATION=-